MIIPYGLDDARVSRVPWVSIALLAANVLVWIGTDILSDADRRAMEAGVAVEHYVKEHPHLRVPPGLREHGFPDAARAAPPAGADAGPEQAQLDALADAFTSALEAQPIRRFGLVPARGIAQPGWLTHMFLHGGFMHLLGNMLVFFLICAPFLEDAWGAGFFLAFYLLGGLFAAVAQALPDMSSQVPCVGASGAICACLGAFSVRFAQRRVRVAYLFFLGFRFVRGTTFVPAWAWGLLGLAGDLLGLAMSSGARGGVAYAAHVGGFSFGAAAAFLIARSGREWKRARSSGEFVVHPAVEKGDAALALGQAARARAEFQKALAVNPADAEARLRLFRLDLAEGRTDAAVAHLERLATAADPTAMSRAAQDAAERIEPSRLRPATAVRLAEALGPGHRAVARRVLEAATGSGGVLGARALALAAELAWQDDPAAAVDLAVRAAQVPEASPALVARAERAAARARAELRRHEELREISLEPDASSEPQAEPSAAGFPVPPTPATWCRVLGVDDEALALETEGGQRSRVPLGRVEAVAVGVVEEVGAPVPGRAVVTDLRIRPGGAAAGPVHLRLPGSWLGLSALHPGVSAQEAFSRFIRHLLERSGATPRPSAAQVAGPLYARFPDLAAFEKACWHGYGEAPR